MLFRLAVRGKRGSLVSIPDCMCIGSCPKAAHGRGILLSYMQLVFIANFESFLPYYMSRHFPLPPSGGCPTSYLTSTHPISGMRVQDFRPTKSANRQSARPFSLGSTTMWASGRLIAAHLWARAHSSVRYVVPTCTLLYVLFSRLAMQSKEKLSKVREARVNHMLMMPVS